METRIARQSLLMGSCLQRQGSILILCILAEELSRSDSHCPMAPELYGDQSTLVGWHKWERSLHVASGTTAAASRHEQAL